MAGPEVPPGEQPQAPLSLGLKERTGRQLLQFDVTIRGKAEIAESLTPEDFKIFLDGRRVVDFTLDLLSSAGRPRQEGQRTETAALRKDVIYVLYFDQLHLTTTGRLRSLELARELVTELVVGGSRGMVVSSGRRLRFYTDLTTDAGELLRALDRLATDGEQMDSFSDYEEQRLAQIFDVLEQEVDWASGIGTSMRRGAEARAANLQNASSSISAGSGGTVGLGPSGGTSPEEAADAHDQDAMQMAVELVRSASSGAASLAREFQRTERWNTDRALARFAAVLGRLAEEQPPKALVYFADTMRSKPGNHYLELIHDKFGALAYTGTSGAYDQVVETAQAHGVRLYTVEARGLAGGAGSMATSAFAHTFVSSNPGAGLARFQDARDSLVLLAYETGGRAFLNGVRGERIARAIREDLACVYLVSIDAASLPRDRRLRLRVHVRKPVEARTRASVFNPSESTRLRTRISDAFMNPDAQDEGSLHARVLPTGFADGRYTALVQVAVPPSTLGPATWDVGVSIVARDEVKQAVSGRITLGDRPALMVFEHPVSVAPGSYELVAVAHDTLTDRVLSAHSDGTWPDPKQQRVTVGPVELLQTRNGVFARDGQVRRRGSFAIGAGETARARLPSAFTTIVCRKRPTKTPLLVERTLVGETSTRFDPPLRIEASEDSCVLIQDVVRGATLGAGAFSYELRVREEGAEEPITIAQREFAVE